MSALRNPVRLVQYVPLARPTLDQDQRTGLEAHPFIQSPSWSPFPIFLPEGVQRDSRRWRKVVYRLYQQAASNAATAT
jgi:hypothetical protein